MTRALSLLAAGLVALATLLVTGGDATARSRDRGWDHVAPAVETRQRTRRATRHRRAAYTVVEGPVRAARRRGGGHRVVRVRPARFHAHAHVHETPAVEVRRGGRRRVGGAPGRLAAAVGGGGSGLASYYWQGHTTASGARFNPEGMTAAHRSLPFGTRVRVTHMGNGRSVVVTINDRGPFVGGRIIDLSRGAAGVLGMHQQGVANVRVDVIGR